MDPANVTDDELVAAMFDRDPALAMIARRIYDARHAADPAPAEPHHCPLCFEGWCLGDCQAR